STCRLGRQPRSGPRRSPPPAAALKRSASSCPTQRWAIERSPKSPLHAQTSRTDARLSVRALTGPKPASAARPRRAGLRNVWFRPLLGITSQSQNGRVSASASAARTGTLDYVFATATGHLLDRRNVRR